MFWIGPHEKVLVQLGYEVESSAVNDDGAAEMTRRRMKGRCIGKCEREVALCLSFCLKVNWFLEC